MSPTHPALKALKALSTAAEAGDGQTTARFASMAGRVREHGDSGVRLCERAASKRWRLVGGAVDASGRRAVVEATLQAGGVDRAHLHTLWVEGDDGAWQVEAAVRSRAHAMGWLRRELPALLVWDELPRRPQLEDSAARLLAAAQDPDIEVVETERHVVLSLRGLLAAGWTLRTGEAVALPFIGRGAARIDATHPDHDDAVRWIYVARDATGVWRGLGIEQHPRVSRILES